MQSNLKSRIAKLEAHVAFEVMTLPAIVVGVCNHPDEDIFGVGLGGKRTFRLAGETVNAMVARAGRELKERVLFAIYRDGSEAC